MDKYYVCIKIRKSLLKGEYICIGNMMLLYNINTNMRIFHPSYSGVYQGESEIQEISTKI